MSSSALRRAGLAAVLLAALALSAFAFGHLGVRDVTDAVASVQPAWALVAFVLMAFSMTLRGEAWYAVLGPLCRAASFAEWTS